MASNAQYLAANLRNHYQFKQQQFNSILKYLVSQESITPGASTALIQDIQRQQSALKERRLALSRLRQSGLLADKDLIVEIAKIKSDLQSVTARGITDVATAKANLNKIFEDELRDEQSQGTSQFTTAVNAPNAQEDARLEVLAPSATEDEVVESVVRYYNDHLKSRHEQLGSDSVAYAQFNQSLKQHLQDIADTRSRIVGGEAMAGAGDKALAQLGITTSETPDQADTRVRAAFRKEVVDPLRAGRAGLGNTTARAIALGIDENRLQEIFTADVYTDSPDARKFARAAFFSRYLPQNLDEDLQPRIGGEGLTEAEFLAKLQDGDSEANRLYSMVLQREPSEVALLSEGQYPYELYQITKSERGLDKSRGQLGQALDPSTRRQGYESLYQEARSIYNNLFRGGGVRDPGSRRANKQRLERGGPELQAAVREVGATDDTQYIGNATPEQKAAIAAESEGKVAVSGQDLVSTATGEPVQTLAGLVIATGGGEEAAARVAAAAETFTPAMTQAALAQAAQPATDFAMQAYSSLGGTATDPMSTAMPTPALPTASVPPTPPPRGPLNMKQAQELSFLGVPDTAARVNTIPDPVAIANTAFATGLNQGTAIRGQLASSSYLADKETITNDDLRTAAIQAYEGATRYDLTAAQRSTLEDLAATSGGAFTEQNIKDSLGDTSLNSAAVQAAAMYTSALSAGK